MIYIYIENKKFTKQISYVFDTIFEILGIETVYMEEIHYSLLTNKDILLLYIDTECVHTKYKDLDVNKIFILNSGELFSDSYLLDSSLPKDIRKFNLVLPIKDVNDVVSLYHGSSELYINKDNLQNNIVISTNIDMISDTFFMLTRYEEFINKRENYKERYGRFSVKDSICYRYGLIQRPIVNEYIELIWSLIQEANFKGNRKKWWGNNEFAVCLTHDVDEIKMYTDIFKVTKHMLALFIKYKDTKRALSFIKKYVEVLKDYKQDPFWTFEYLINTEIKYDFRSSFYFMSGGTSKYDGKYNINDKRLVKILDKLYKLGFEAGYHGSFYSYDNLVKMKEEIKSIEKNTQIQSYGCRQHFLRFKIPSTWEIQEKSGLLYDTTLGYAEIEGFRSGICFPYKPFDLIENRVLNIWEIPLIVMDVTLKDEKYRHLNYKEGADVIINLINTVKKYNGVFTLLWHNTSFTDEWNGWTQVYEDTIKYLYELNAFGVSGREVINILNEEIRKAY